ncbi:glycoside hydrolase family 18 protein [Pelomonas sp. SE-A7]|uniref:glycoside hydrolase family 18 protein n=1 Tax=Pelomonas sp. SE-A7 TaxID=3054953 RepID=UPI00259CE090|nr:glycoside hydrolase family 18 protein [Pelomonas sp. SE-A7]MDM4768076.1 glycoside hydrolase family 18 protein [Pelomonas sp. SE-A7]
MRLLTAALAALSLASTAVLAAPPLFGAGPLAFENKPGSPVVGVYVPGWEGVEQLDKIKPGSLSHILYAFLRICGPGQLEKDAKTCAGRPEFSLTDTELERRFDAGFVALKKRLPALQVVASVGGWGGSDPFFHLANDAAKRQVFAKDVVRFLREHPGFDGIDIDWEHPGGNGSANGVALGSPADGQGYADLMVDLRAAVDQLGRETGRRYLVTTAVNSSSTIVDRIKFRQAAPALDLVFMMTYDFFGPWTDTAGHHAALKSARKTDDSVERSVANLVKAGVPRAKLVAGVAMYGRGFAGVTSKQGHGAAKTGNYPDNGDGSTVYRELRADRLDAQGRGLNGWVVQHDKQAAAFSLYQPEQKLWISYDDPRAVLEKGRYARRAGLAGVFAWELSQDHEGELLNAMNLGVGKKPR